MSKILLLKIQNEILLEERGEITLEQVERLKWVVVQECEVFYDDVEVEIIDTGKDLSDIDCDNNGLFNWKEYIPQPYSGLSLTIKEGSDQYLEALTNGTLLDYIKFI